MCGIIAYIGDGNTVQVLIEGLERMEYRGYDSAGCAVIRRDTGKLEIEKKVGKVVNLKNAVSGRGFEGNASLGIGHTRWATHGPPSDRNAHPHASADGKLAIVHNGIIENYVALKKKLKSLGYEFKSDTDTEVLAALIRHVQTLEPTLSLSAAVSLALTQVRGAYGIAVIDEKEPDVLVGARHGSPLILGVSDQSFILASDATAVVGLTEKVLYLEDEDIVTCSRNANGEYQFNVANMKRDSMIVENSGQYRPRASTGRSRMDSDDDSVDFDSSSSSQDGKRLDRSIRRQITLASASVNQKVYRDLHELTMNLETIEKGGYEHFMLKEIMEQPKVLRDCMRGRIDHMTGAITLGGLSAVWDKIVASRRIIICACGTSWHSALVGEYIIEALAGKPVEVEYASEFRYRSQVLFEDDVVIVISQSGETADTMEALKVAKQNKCLGIGIVNVVGSSIARETDAGIYLHVGPEIGVASTKAFTGQVLALSMFAICLARRCGTLAEDKASEYGLELLQIPDKIEAMLTEENCKRVKEMASTYRYAHNFLYLGRGFNFPVALEGALKLKEISYIHAEGYPAAEMKHGPIALIDEMMPVVILAPKQDKVYEKVRSGIEEVIARKGSVISITDEGNRDLDNLSEFVFETPKTNEIFYPLVNVIPLQLLSYYIAKMRGCDIDRPRNLAKAVCTE